MTAGARAAHGRHCRPDTAVAGERGSASVLTVAVVMALVLVGSGALLLAGTVRDVHRARAAADLAALAAAAPTRGGGRLDCASASTVASANGAAVVRCRQSGDGSAVVAVAVVRRSTTAWGWLPSVVRARARAGVVEHPPADAGRG